MRFGLQPRAAVVERSELAKTRRPYSQAEFPGGSSEKNQLDVLLTPKEVSAHTGVSLDTLAQWRSQKRGIPYLKVGRLVRYDPLDVQQYLAGCRVSVSLLNERRWR